MKNLREWRDGVEEYSNANTLLDRLNKLAKLMEIELESFVGDRPEGFLDICGATKELKRRIVEIEMGIAGDRPHFQTEHRRPAANQIGLFSKHDVVEPEDEEMEDEPVTCPGCGAENGPESMLGKLGNSTHYRCRQCGMVHSPNSGETARSKEGPNTFPSHWDEE
jgi:hypothetical protein